MLSMNELRYAIPNPVSLIRYCQEDKNKTKFKKGMDTTVNQFELLYANQDMWVQKHDQLIKEAEQGRIANDAKATSSLTHNLLTRLGLTK